MSLIFQWVSPSPHRDGKPSGSQDGPSRLIRSRLPAAHHPGLRGP